MKWTPNNQMQNRSRHIATLALSFVASLGVIGLPADAFANAWFLPQGASEDAEDQATPPAEREAWETFVPDFEDNDLAGTENRAWEFRPYRVAVWFCLDGSPTLEAIYPRLTREVTTRSELLDASGWDLETGRCPAKYRSELLQNLAMPDRLEDFPDLSLLESYDKLMVVTLQRKPDHTLIRVREFDVQTQQWGPITRRRGPSVSSLAAGVVDAIAASFMPVAKIERVTEVAVEGERPRDEVVMQVRAVNACVTTTWQPSKGVSGEVEIVEDPPSGESSEGDDSGAKPDENFQLVEKPLQTSPVFVRNTDRFLPVIRRSNRDGELEKIEPVAFTYLMIEKSEEAEVRASIQSSFRAPLNRRAGRRSQKLALVIRPPESPTTLRLVTMSKSPEPLEGMEVFSRKPNQAPGTSNEFLGLTDWRGEIEIPPAKEGLRLILVSRGSRRLKRIPIIPGLFPEVETDLPNDETRLYAEGVFRGLESEILSLITQRTVATAEIEAALEKEVVNNATKAYEAYKDLEDLADLKERVSSSAADLKFLTSDNRELQYIDDNLTALLGILDKEIKKSKDSEYLEQIQKLDSQAATN